MRLIVLNFLILLNIGSIAQANDSRGRFASIQATPIEGGFELLAEVISKSSRDPIEFTISAPLMIVNHSDQSRKAQVARFYDLYSHMGHGNLSTGEEAQIGSVHLKRISEHRFQFRTELRYEDLNRQLQVISPNLMIGPGSNLFLEGVWQVTGSNGIQHQMGLSSRGGGFVTPSVTNSSETSQAITTSNATAASPLTLDHALEIDQATVDQFNYGTQGLKLGGQIHSRLESEGKFQVGIRELPYLINRLFSLSSNVNPIGLDNIDGLGPEWELKLMDQYLVKDDSGQAKLVNGLPVMHPMVDTYYDHNEFLTARTDMAVRYRFTEHNGIGNWNIKPGGGVLHKNKDGNPTGIVDRVEYGLDVTDGDANSIASFADSQHLANPFRIVRGEMTRLLPQYGDVTPSSLLYPSVKLTTYRYKFLLANKVTGLEIEVSIDDVWAQALRYGSLHNMVRFAQVEMDIEHVAAVVNSTAQSLVETGGGALTQRWNGQGIGLASEYTTLTLANGDQVELISQFSQSMDRFKMKYPRESGYVLEVINPSSAKVLIPSLHTIDTLSNNSPLRQAVATTLGPAAEAIEAFRSLLMDLTPFTIAPPKAALASVLLYGHQPSQGVNTIKYEIEDPQSHMFDRNLRLERPSPNVFPCKSMLGAK